MNIQPEKRAELVANASVKYENNRRVEQQEKLDGQTKALAELRKNLMSFRSTIKGLNSFDGGIVKNKVIIGKDDVVNITSTGKAVKGSYELEVTQLASNHKIGYEKLTDTDVETATGKLKLGVDNKEFEIDLDNLKTLDELAHAININPDNKGVAASIYRINGQQQLVLSSNETGAANTIKIDSGSTLLSRGKEISTPLDAQVKLDGINITSPSNTLTTIPGVSIELKKQSVTNEKLCFSISPDEAGTQEQAQKFVEAYNKLKESFSSLMVSGSKENSVTRGAFAGDATFTTLQNKLYETLYATYDGKTLSQLGIETARDGTLSVNSKQLNESLKNDPGALTNMFNGPNGLIKGMDEILAPYLKAGGTLKERQNQMDIQQKELNKTQEKLDKRLNEVYLRNLKIFTEVQATMDKMKSSQNALFTMLNG